MNKKCVEKKQDCVDKSNSEGYKQSISHTDSEKKQPRNKEVKNLSVTPPPLVSSASIFSNRISDGLSIDTQNTTRRTNFGETLLKTLDTAPLPPNADSEQSKSLLASKNAQKLESPGVFTFSIPSNKADENQVKKAKTESLKPPNNSSLQLREPVSSVQKCTSSKLTLFRSGLLEAIDSSGHGTACTSLQSSSKACSNNPATNKLSRNQTKPQQAPCTSHSPPDLSTKSISSDELPGIPQVVTKATHEEKTLTVSSTRNSIFPSQAKLGIDLKLSEQTGSTSKNSSFLTGLLDSINSKAKPLLAANNSESHTASPNTCSKSLDTKTFSLPEPYSCKHSNPFQKSKTSSVKSTTRAKASHDQSKPSNIVNRSHAKTASIDKLEKQPSAQTTTRDKSCQSHLQQSAGGTLSKCIPKETTSVSKSEIQSSVGSTNQREKVVDILLTSPRKELVRVPKEFNKLHSASVEPNKRHQEERIPSDLNQKSALPLGTTPPELTPGKEPNYDGLTEIVQSTSKATTVNSTEHTSRRDSNLKMSTQTSQRSHPYKRKPNESETVNQPFVVNHKASNEQPTQLLTASGRHSEYFPEEQFILPHQELYLTCNTNISPQKVSVQVLPVEGGVSVLPDSCVQPLSTTHVTYPLARVELVNITVPLPFSSRRHLEIFTSRPEVVKLLEPFTGCGTTVQLLSDNGNHMVVISGTQNEVLSAKEQVQCLAEEITKRTVTSHVRCPLKAIPLLCSTANLQHLLQYQKEKCLDITFVRRYDCQPPLALQEFSNIISNRTDSIVFKTRDFQELLHRGPKDLSDFCWQATNDFGEFAVSLELDHILKSYNASSGKEQFHYNGKLYTVDFAKGVILESTTGKIRSIRQVPFSSYQWQVWSNEHNRFISHPQSKDVELFFQFGGVCLDVADSKCTFNFQESQFTQIDVQKETEVLLQRIPTPVSTTDFEITIGITGLDLDVDFVRHSIMELSKETTNKCELQFDVPLDKRSLIQAQIKNIVKQYFVSVHISAIGDDKICVVLEGAQDYVQNVHKLLSELTLKTQQHLLESMTMTIGNIPPEWVPQDENCEIKQVARSSQEWEKIHDLMKKTLSDVKVQSIERIQNKHLWEKYCIERKHMIERNGKDGVNELCLFHGSGKTDPRNIAKSAKGIDFRFSSRDHNLMWGTGAYFAVKASYSDNYAYCSNGIQNGPKEMILASVLGGRSVYSEPNKDLKVPPQLPNSTSERYDTVNGKTGGSEVYIVYDHDKSYPAYIITYSVK